MFGSDYPFWDAPATVDTVDAAGLDAESRAAIEHGNASRLFGLGVPA
jgi:predicted TIM-barrel fold metal-dependent hydrolase